jgi:hypothetical protein
MLGKFKDAIKDLKTVSILQAAGLGMAQQQWGSWAAAEGGLAQLAGVMCEAAGLRMCEAAGLRMLQPAVWGLCSSKGRPRAVRKTGLCYQGHGAAAEAGLAKPADRGVPQQQGRHVALAA